MEQGLRKPTFPLSLEAVSRQAWRGQAGSTAGDGGSQAVELESGVVLHDPGTFPLRESPSSNQWGKAQHRPTAPTPKHGSGKSSSGPSSKAGI